MNAKPTHLTPENAARFQQQSIVARYHLRPPYPQEAFDILASLISEPSRTILDVGTGIGDLARPLAAQVERVDAVDVSRSSGLPLPSDKRLVELIRRFSLEQNYQPYDLAEELEKGGFFHR